MQYSESLRYISVKREGKSPLILVTNLKDVSAEAIAELYKSRWKIELFFKWIKQNLRLKKFLGQSSNAVKIQIATALIAFILIWIFKNISNEKCSPHLFLVWVKHNLHVTKYRNRQYKPPIYIISRRPVYL